jgi:Protein of unknown function (DUF2442)
MGKVKIGEFEVEEEELERQHREAVRRGREKEASEPQAAAADYDPETNRLRIELKNGVVFIVPCELIEGLRGADPAQIAEVELGPRGASLHWERLDQDFSVAGLMAGVFGSRVWMAKELGRHGGNATSERKAAAVRENGRKGGRPKTKTA